jgi:hypothetical protein
MQGGGDKAPLARVNVPLHWHLYEQFMLAFMHANNIVEGYPKLA